MQFANISTLIEAYLHSKIQQTSFQGASLFLNIAELHPLTLEDSTKAKLVSSEQDIQILEVKQKIVKNTNLCLEDVEVQIQLGENYVVNNIQIASKEMRTNIGQQQTRIKGLQLRFRLQKIKEKYPLTIRSLQYIRRLQRQLFMKKYYKPSKMQASKFFTSYNKTIQQQKYKISPQVISLDTQSISILEKLLLFTNKAELFNILIRQPLSHKQSKKAVRLAIVPTHVEICDEGLQIIKKQYNRQTVTELLEQYKAQEKRAQK